ncbi:MAG: hypothetical protein GEV10_02285 [Streptosporangiales bacterium]|nr:hypothetical protein [Streptosporangiales bacterium]
MSSPSQGREGRAVRQWFRRFRVYVILAPLTLALGFGYNGYEAWTGNDGVAHRAEDVPKGEWVTLGPTTVRLMAMTQRQPSSDPDATAEVPIDSVVVIARFQAKVNDVKKLTSEKKIFGCDSTVENGDGWTWDSETLLGKPYVADTVSQTCSGKTMTKDFKDKFPKQGDTFEYVYAYFVPKERAKELRPTLAWYPEYPRYYRFAVR